MTMRYAMRYTIGVHMTTRFCMGCQRDVVVLDLLAWKAIFNKLGKVTRRVCPACAAGRKKFDATGVYKRA